MENSQNQGRPGHRKGFRRIDEKIWLWASGRSNVTKREIKERAKTEFEKGGFPSFKASDGWYRRWQGRWKRNGTMNEEEKKELKTVVPNERLTDIPQGEGSSSVGPLNSLKYSKLDCIDKLTNPIIEPFDLLKCDENEFSPSRMRTEDCVETTVLNLKAANIKPVVATKKKIERYLPHFKTKVVTYASKYSIKDAAFHFKVNKSTIADWMREEDQRCSTSVDGTLQVEFRPDLDFIEWLQIERKSGRLITKDALKNKFKELSSLDQNAATKKTLWFFKYMDRFANESINESSFHIMYPTPFRRELAKLCGKLSKKMVSRLFNVDRKRITDWAQRYLNDNYSQSERKVGCYLTDDKIDAELWNWYSTKTTKPNSKQVRDKAVEMYRQAGYNNIGCSSGWYYRWRKRYTLPSSSVEKKEFDDQLVEWILCQFDDNKSISHAELISQATTIKGGESKLSSSWIVRFLKRHSHLLQKRPNPFTKLPSSLERRVNEFKSELSVVLDDRLINFERLFVFDEVPLNFSMTGVQKSPCLLRKSGFDNCHASLILVCSGNGALHPPTLILKAPENDDDKESEELESCVTVVHRVQGTVDSSLLSDWFAKLVLLVDHFFFVTKSQNIRKGKKSSIFVCDSFALHKELQTVHHELLKERGSQLMLIPDGCSSRLLPIVFGISDEFKKAINVHWEKWLQSICWNVGHGVKLPPEKDIKKWILEAYRQLNNEMQDIIKDYFLKMLSPT